MRFVRVSPSGVLIHLGSLISVDSITDRNQLERREDGLIVYVQNLQVFYQLSPDLVTWIFFDASPNLSKQEVWEINPDTGNDLNDGKTKATALASMLELANRLCPRGTDMLLTNNVTAYVDCNTTTTFIRARLSVRTENLSDNYRFRIVGGTTSGGSIVLSNVIAANAPTVRASVSTLSGAFIDKKLIVVTSGSAVGCVSYCSGLNGSALSAFCGEFVLPTWAGFHVPHLPIAGDTCEVLSLKIKFFQCEFYGSNGGTIEIQYIQIVRFLAGGSALNSPSADAGGNVVFGGCELTSGIGTGGQSIIGVCMFGCRVVPTAKVSIQGEGWLFWACSVQGRLVVAGADVRSYGQVIDGGQINIGTTKEGVPGTGRSVWTFNGSYNTNGGLEVVNGPNASVYGAALTITGDSDVFINTVAWGLSTPYAVGVVIETGGLYVTKHPGVSAFVDILKIPSIVNVKMGGQSFTWAQMPVALQTINCGVYLAYIDANFSESYLSLVERANNIAPTTLISTPYPGVYTFNGYIAVSVPATSGAPVLNVIFTDDSGIPRTVALTGSPITIETNGAAIQYSVTGIVTPGPLSYSLKVGCKREQP